MILKNFKAYIFFILTVLVVNSNNFVMAQVSFTAKIVAECGSECPYSKGYDGGYIYRVPEELAHDPILSCDLPNTPKKYCCCIPVSKKK